MAPVNNEQQPDRQQQEEEEWTAERLLLSGSYKDLGSPAVVEDRFVRHLLAQCRGAVEELLQTDASTTTRDYSCTVSAYDLLAADPVLGHMLLRFPATLLPLLESAIVRAQRELVLTEHGEEAAGPSSSSPLMIKGCRDDARTTRVHARLVHLPPACCKPVLGGLEASDVGKIWQVSGTCVRTSSVQMYESARTYKCCATGKKPGCGRTFLVHADLEQRHNALTPPKQCPLRGPNGERCPGTKLKQVEGGSVHTDYQEIKIQETSAAHAAGHIPRSLLIKAQHDLVDQCQPGDEVVVVGMLLAQWQQQHFQPDQECHVGMALSAHSIRVLSDKRSSAWNSSSDNNNSVGEMDKFRQDFTKYWEEHQNEPFAARDYICQAVCPKLYGLQVIKLALLLTLIGGVSSESCGNETIRTPQTERGDNGPVAFRLDEEEPVDKNSTAAAYYGERRVPAQTKAKQQQQHVKTRRRDQSHLLLVGDPGTGKSQFLRFAAALCPRSVLTTGVGTTSAGLTCAAVREGSGKEFALEAGALVLADKGVCCIDEFGCIREADRTTIHEAMEQQTLSVAKAGIVCKLNCRATIIAVMNPRDCLYDNHASLSVNTGLGTPLLSRFDLIFKLVDSSDAERDSNVTTYLLNRAIQGAGFDVADALPTGNEHKKTSNEPWSMEKLRAYISLAKEEREHPLHMSDDAAALLTAHYERCRSSNHSIPVTVRFLESLIRLSQAHARLMYHDTVTLQDAVAVIEVMECTAFAYGGFDGVNVADDFENVLYRDPMTVDFSDDPDLDFCYFEYRVLKLYGMLDRMDDERRRRALADLNASSQQNASWQDLECNGGGAPPSFPNDAIPSSMDAWDTHQQQNQDVWGSQPSATQDHYGRIHFDPSPSQSTQGKRRRHS